MLRISQFQAWPSPRAKPRAINFFMGEFHALWAKRKFNNPRVYKNELKPHPRAFSSRKHKKNETEIMQNCKILSSLDD